ncbi:MAG: hypothetical protein IT260_19715 [Saprospiraceae bacterium]|nr:hypothetical protein [Saprospiraceae bacterium]
MSKPISSILTLTLALSGSVIAPAQNCPSFSNCPNNILTLCETANNDPALWHDPAFTWSPMLESADLPDGPVDLNALATVDCIGTFTMRYVLFLDLDGDNLAETAIPSNSTLPRGKILFGNAFTPGYLSTDTLQFDKRAVPDSLKFRFSLQSELIGNQLSVHLRWAGAPGNYQPARLPIGKHRIQWILLKNGVPQLYCEYIFRVKDCQPPALSCHNTWNATIPGSDTLLLQATDLVQHLTDNVTPNALLQLSMRRAGTGQGFPLDDNGDPVTQLPFACPELGQHEIEVWARDLADNDSTCTSSLTVVDFEGNCPGAKPAVVCAKTIFPQSDTMQHVDYRMETLFTPGHPAVALHLTPLPNGCLELPDFSPYQIEEVAITPRKNKDQLNGVTTFDLVLINRHIVGSQLFNRTWKYLAADANNSGSITTLDIVELRKLILGIYDSLPHSDAWKFLMADCTLDSLAPFQSTCPGTIGFDPDAIPEELLFLGIKTGDVNGNAAPDSLGAGTTPRTPSAITLPDRQLAAGEILELPLFAGSPAEWQACQWALQWDSSQLRLDAVLPGRLKGLEAGVSLRQLPELLALSWMSETPVWVTPTDALCTLRLRALAPLQLSEALRLAAQPLAPEAYSPDGIPTALRLEFIEKQAPGSGGAIFDPQPNPSSSTTRFPYRLDQPGLLRLDIMDVTGRPLFHVETHAEAGAGALEWPAAAAVPAGVYLWRIEVGQVTKTGRLLRL